MLFRMTSERMQVLVGALAIVCLTAATLAIGQPTHAERVAARNEALLEARSVYVHPAELLDLLPSEEIYVRLLDVRSEADFAQFHLAGATHISTEGIVETVLDMYAAKHFADKTAFVLMSNDETAATEAWRLIAAAEKLHVYILAGGINGWVDTFADAEFKATHTVDAWQNDELAYTFGELQGEEHPLANLNPEDFDIPYEAKVHISAGEDTKSESAPAPSTGPCG